MRSCAISMSASEGMFIVANSSRCGLDPRQRRAAVVFLGGSHTGAEPDAETDHHSIA